MRFKMKRCRDNLADNKTRMDKNLIILEMGILMITNLPLAFSKIAGIAFVVILLSRSLVITIKSNKKIVYIRT
jgi:hypothetical protein